MEPFPFGYRFTLIPHDEEQQVVAYIGHLHFEEGLSQRRITKRLNEEGILCRGRPWHQGSLSKVIKREFPDRKAVGWRQRVKRKGGRGG